MAQNEDTVDPVWLPNGQINPVYLTNRYLLIPPVGPFLPSAEYLNNSGNELLLIQHFGENDPTPLLSTRGNEVYVGMGKFIDENIFQIAERKKPKKFLRSVVRFHYSRNKLSNRYVEDRQGRNVLLQISDATSPRKAVTPQKFNIITEIFKIYLNKGAYSENKKIDYLNKVRSYISMMIRDLLQGKKKEARVNIVRRRLLYDK